MKGDGDMTIQAGSREYERIVEAGQLVGLRRFDSAHKVWVELRFDETADRRIEEDLVSILTGEYISRQSGL